MLMQAGERVRAATYWLSLYDELHEQLYDEASIQEILELLEGLRIWKSYRYSSIKNIGRACGLIKKLILPVVLVYAVNLHN